MTEEFFNTVLAKRLERIEIVLHEKAKEYRKDNNPMHNFEMGAQMSGKSREEVLDGFLLKHLVSVKDMIADLKKGKCFPEFTIDEKLGDIINYFILLEASMLDTNMSNIKEDDDNLPF